ncbi:hypothetical protein [Clostridium sp.]|uniref:hypothetical protein n=1 Tax=Clostridium sp. TaxID=1506 RepID=UPI0029146E4D|nr:hypothetical protein [Clostridium sp.]MDU6522118.1 hypothetical protein [Clostridium sp.]
MKNLFLYYSYDNITSESLSNLNDIYMFLNKKIIAVDKNVYNKNERIKLQKQIDIQPYYITQRIFKELLIESINSEIKIINVLFEDELDDVDEYLELIEYIQKSKNNQIVKQIDFIMVEFETKIEKLEVAYDDNRYSLTSSGVLDVYDSDNIKKLLADKIINRKLLGLT